MKKKLLLIILFCFSFGLFSIGQITLEITVDKHTICEGETVHISANPEGATTSSAIYLWTNYTGEDNIDNIYSGDINVSPSKSDTFYIQVDLEYWVGAVLEDTTIFAKVAIGVFKRPIVDAGPNNLLCINQEHYFEFSDALGEFSKLWNHNGLGTLINETTPNPTYYPGLGETGEIEFVLKGISNYCEDVTDTVYLTYFPSPTAQIITADDSICSHENFEINGDVGGTESFTWEIWPPNAGKGYLVNDNSLNPTYIPNIKEYEQVKIILHAHGDGCTVSDTLVLTVSQMLVEGSPDTTICVGDILNLSVTPSPETDYLWSTGGTQNYIQIQPDTEGEYIYTVEAWNPQNCYFADTIVVKVIESPIIELGLDAQNQIMVVEPANLVRYIFYGNDKTVLQDDVKNTFYYGGQIREMYDTIFVVAYNEAGCSNNEDDMFSDFMELPMLKKSKCFLAQWRWDKRPFAAWQKNYRVRPDQQNTV